MKTDWILATALSIGMAFGFAGPLAVRSASAASPLTGGQPRAADDASDAVVRRVILIRPKPAAQEFRSTLYPSRDRLQPGSAAPIFLRQNFEATAALKVLRETYARKDGDVPLDELDVKAIRGGVPLRWSELRRAAFRERAGWEYPIGEEPAAYILLPDVQESRLYNHAILLAVRADVKEGKLVDAADKISIALGLARHIGETPFAVCRQVQIAQVDRSLAVVEELLQHPASDNLYWSLSALPRPMVATQDAFQFESSMPARTFPMLANGDSRLTEKEWEQVARDVLALIGNVDGSLPREGTPEAQRRLDEWVAKARAGLPKLRPEWAARVASMSDAEAGVRYWFERVRDQASRQCALGMLEYPQALPRLADEEARLFGPDGEESVVRSAIMLPAALMRGAALTDQRVALLRTIEAVRDWSSKHDGRLPASLHELDLPAPSDCVTGSPFKYVAAADGRSATLEGAVVESVAHGAGGAAKTTRRGFRYELHATK